jgi:hypothetical protein
MKFFVMILIALFLVLGEWVAEKLPVDFKFVTGCVWGTLTIIIWGALAEVLCN